MSSPAGSAPVDPSALDSSPLDPSRADDGAVIVFDRVTKFFGAVVAVSDVSFRIRPGITALLGPNGAGKSTVLRLLCGLTRPSQGSITVLGRSPRGDIGLYRHIGIVPQQESIFEPITGLRFVAAMAELSGVEGPERAARDAISIVELEPDDPRPLGTYSKGMRQRVKVAAALVHSPQLVVLDEPLNGLDPRQRLRMIELLQQLGAEGRTVIVSSHVLDEVERFGSRILMIAAGRLAAEGDFHAIRALMDDRPHQIRIEADPVRPLAAALIHAPGIVAVRVTGPTTMVADVHDVAGFRRSVLPYAIHAGSRVTEIAPLDEGLESVFRYLVGAR
jgi:ABC-2 type transport system ATP-binding protein